jgi:hypothetical protein
MNCDLITQLKDAIQSFVYFSVALDDSTDANDTAQLLIFMQGVTDKIDIVN